MKSVVLSIAALVILCRPEIGRAQSRFAPTDSIGQIHQNALSLDRPDSQRNKLCFRAQGCPNCDTIILLEFAMVRSLGSIDASPFGNGEFGLLQNVSDTYGIGGTVFYGGDEFGSHFGLRGRLRRWLSPQIGLDIAPGIVLGGQDDYGLRQFPAFSGQVALDLWGLVAPMYELDMQRTSEGVRWNSALGLRSESYAAPIIVAALIGIAAATWEGSNGW